MMMTMTMDFRVALVILAVTLTCGSAGPALRRRRNTGEPGEIPCVEGETVTIPCHLDGLSPSDIIIWSKGDEFISYSTMLFKHVDRYLLSPDTLSITITNVSGVEDGGTFRCKANGKEDVFYDTTLHVKMKPYVGFGDDIIIILEGADFEFDCDADGNPAPEVVWTRKDGGRLGVRDDDATTSYEGDTLRWSAATDELNGEYVCAATNKLGSDMKTVTVVVGTRPVVTADERVQTQEGATTVLTCVAEGKPEPTMHWYRVTDNDDDSMEPLMQGEGVNIKNMQETSKVTEMLEISETTLADFGDYACKANSSHGDDVTRFVVTGLPFEVRLDEKGSSGYKEDAVLLRWSVESVAPITSYIVYYKESETKEDRWMEERAPALSNEGRMHQEMYELKGLRPDTEYDVMIVAENKYGSYRESEETSVWTFRTQAEGVEVPTPEPETYWPEPEPESEGDSKPEQVQTEDKSGAERTRCVGVAMAIVMLLATMVV